MSHKTALLVLGSLIVLSSCREKPSTSVSNEKPQAKFAEAYAIAISYPDELPKFAVENAQFFSEDGPSIMVGRALVPKLRSAALQGPLPDEITKQAYAVAEGVGQPDLAKQAANDIISQRGELLQLASFVEQLVETLPSAASGNPEPYKDTLLYMTNVFVWNAAVQMIPDENWKGLRDMSMEMNKWYVASLIEASQ